MLIAGITPRILERGYMLVFLPITVPGLRTLLHPISTKSPIIEPNFFRPVSIMDSPLTEIKDLSDLMFDVMDPAPMCDL